MWNIVLDNPVPLNVLKDIADESKEVAKKNNTLNVVDQKYEKGSGYSAFWHTSNYDIWKQYKDLVDICETLAWNGKNETQYALRFWEWNGTNEIKPHIDPDHEGIGNLLVPIIGTVTTHHYGWWDKELTPSREEFPVYEDWKPETHAIDSVRYGPGQMMALNASRMYHGVKCDDDYRLLVQFKLNESVFPR